MAKRPEAEADAEFEIAVQLANEMLDADQSALCERRVKPRSVIFAHVQALKGLLAAFPTAKDRREALEVVRGDLTLERVEEMAALLDEPGPGEMVQ